MNMRPDYIKVNESVKKVLAENAITSPPVSPREIAENNGLIVREVTFKDGYTDISGFIDFNEKVIRVNAIEPIKRQNFTIAHELGHFFLHKDLFEKDPSKYKVFMRRPLGAARDPFEIEANAFAANLLVPSSMLEKYAPVADLASLSTLFVVSKDVIRIRLGKQFGY